MYKRLFTRSLGAAPGRLHLAAHSHHLWPDAAFAGHDEAATDAAVLADHKWERVFGEVVPDLQKKVASTLSLPDPTTLAFAPNVHEFLVRIASSIRPRGEKVRTLRVVTTDGEFHSFERQATRFEEDGAWAVTRVPTEPFDTFASRFAATVRANDPDLVYLSQVFFDSGFVVSDAALLAICAAVPRPEVPILIDGYHGFCAVPTNLAKVASRAFYLAGGYKYAMSGEGVCFAHAPPGYAEKPRITGWFASFGALESPDQGRVTFGADGSRLMGSTFDPSGLYRMRAVLAMLEKEGVTVATARAHARTVEKTFLEALSGGAPAPWRRVVEDEEQRGRFVTFRTDRAGAICDALRAKNVIADARRDRLRFGFGLYQDASVAERAGAALKEIARSSA